MNMIGIGKVRRRLAVAALTLVAAATVVPATTASAAKDYGQLTATWWAWTYSRPAIDTAGTNTHPILDSNGAFAAVGQENGIGPGNEYFFLTGSFGQTLTRTVTVPRGKTLFFPIINIETDNAVDPPTDNGVPALRALAAATIDAVDTDDLSATFDGQAVEFFRSTSPVFDYTLPAENSVYDYFGLFGAQFEGRIKPAVADGYWAVVPPPSPGSHVLHFHSQIGDPPSFVVDITYNLTVA
jgi:hypothetical protein